MAKKATKRPKKQTHFTNIAQPKPLAQTFYFDCWKKDGKMRTKKVVAADAKDAKLLFGAKYPDYAYDEPYT